MVENIFSSFKKALALGVGFGDKFDEMVSAKKAKSAGDVGKGQVVGDTKVVDESKA